MKQLTGILCGVLMLVTSGVVLAAGTSQTGTVGQYQAWSNFDGVVFFKIDDTDRTLPACANPNNQMFAIKTSGGTAHMAQLVLDAKKEGETITVQGTGTCDVWSNVESAWRVTIQ